MNKKLHSYPIVATNLVKRFGSVKAVSGVSFALSVGEVLALQGPNGTGKTTLVNLLSGWLAPDEGSIDLYGERISEYRPEEFFARGIIRSFQSTRILRTLSVVDYLLLACRQAMNETVAAAIIHRSRFRQGDASTLRPIRETLEFLGIEHLSGRNCFSLSGGERRLVELASAVLRQPKTLILDEPTAGLSRESKARIRRIIKVLQNAGVSTILIEHDGSFISAVADRLISIEESSTEAHATSASNGYLLDGGRERPPATGDAQRALLSVSGLTVDYGFGPVLRNLELTINKGEILVIRGPNGAGKSSLLRAILGLVKYQGAINFDGKARSENLSYMINRMGVSYVPQFNAVFPSLSVRENLLVPFGASSKNVMDQLDQIDDTFPEIKTWLDIEAANLSAGQERVVGLARALVQQPRLLILDEPLAGLSEDYCLRIIDLLDRLATSGMGVLIVEHRATLATSPAWQSLDLLNGALKLTTKY